MLVYKLLYSYDAILVVITCVVHDTSIASVAMKNITTYIYQGQTDTQRNIQRNG